MGREPDAPISPTAAPTPPAIPAVDLTPQMFHARPSQAWMAVAPVPVGRPKHLPLNDVPQVIGDRRVHFVMITAQAVDLLGSHGAKVRVTLVPGPTGRVVHVKGLTCFVAPLGGRPSPAVTIDRSSDIALVTPRAQEIGHVRVTQGSPDMNALVFPVGTELLAIAGEDCADPILFDFGPGSEAYFVYTRGRTVPKSGRRG
jgi:hypothetical protein